MSWDWNYTGDIIPDLLDGLRYTVIATLAGYVIAVVLGLVWAMLRRAPNVVVRRFRSRRRAHRARRQSAP